MENKFYQQLSIEQKRKMREILAKLKTLRKNQKEIMEEALIKPIKDQIKLIDDVQKNKISLQHFLKRDNQLRDYLKKWMGKIKESEIQ